MMQLLCALFDTFNHRPYAEACHVCSQAISICKSVFDKRGERIEAKIRIYAH